MVLVVQRGEIEAQQRNAPDPGHRARRQTLAAALDTEQQDPFWRVQARPGIVEGAAPARQPFPQTPETADVGEAFGLEFVVEHPFLVEQFVLGLHHPGQIAGIDGAVVEDGLVGETPRLGGGQAGEIVDQQFQRFPIGAYLAARMFLLPASGLFHHDAADGLPIRQTQAHRGGIVAQLLRQIELVTEQDHRAGIGLVVQGDVLEQAHVDRIVQKGMEVHQHVDPCPGLVAQVTQDFVGLPVAALEGEVEGQGGQPFGQGPLVYRPGQALAQLAQQLQGAALLPRLQGQNGGTRTQGAFEIVTLIHDGKRPLRHTSGNHNKKTPSRLSAQPEERVSRHQACKRAAENGAGPGPASGVLQT